MKYKTGDKVKIKGRNIITEIIEIKTVQPKMDGNHIYSYKLQNFPYWCSIEQIEEVKDE